MLAKVIISNDNFKPLPHTPTLLFIFQEVERKFVIPAMFKEVYAKITVIYLKLLIKLFFCQKSVAISVPVFALFCEGI